MRRWVGALALVFGLAWPLSAAAVPGDAAEATAQQASITQAEWYTAGLEWSPGIYRTCQWTIFECTSTWKDVYGEKPPRLVIVRAGAENGQGALRVETWLWDPSWTRGEEGPLEVEHIAAPDSVGSLTIIKVTGSVLHLRADTGEGLLFDLLSGTYLTHPGGPLQ